MTFNKHSRFKGLHAFLGASKWHWVNYDKDHLITAYQNASAAKRGTELHEFAATCIKLGQRLPRSRKTLNMYVNDAISFKMIPEQILFYSEFCFGTADAIVFRNNTLHIHDYKSGVTLAHPEQLEIYAALFCLEYHYSPYKINIELRIYQSNDILVFNPDPERISMIIDKIKEFDKILKDMNSNELDEQSISGGLEYE